MKTFFFRVIFIVISSSLNGQPIPNSSFETWTNHGNFENPEFWNSANHVTASLSLFTTEKTDDSYTGNFAVRLEAKNLLTFRVPGLVTLGVFDVNFWTQQTSIAGGIDFSDRPQKLNFWYKYNPVEGDNFRVGLWFLKDSGTQVPDTIGVGLFESTEAKDEYTQASVLIDYYTEEEPEILNIVIVSTNPDNPKAGSILKVDDLTFTYNTSVKPFITFETSVFPNPVKDFIYIKTAENCEVKLFDSRGIMLGIINTSIAQQFDLRGFAPGIYFLRFLDEDGITKKVKKFIKT